jgi:serine/threonine-protein kinase SRPK3
VHLRLQTYINLMASILRLAQRCLRPLSPLHVFPIAGFRTLDSALPIEEEREPLYSTKAFYPTRIGEVLNSRYQVVGKLGYGGYSTVWLCRDVMLFRSLLFIRPLTVRRNHEYVTLKLSRSDAPNVKREIEVYNHLNTIRTRHAGATLVRTMIESFQLTKSQQTYQCLVHKPLGMSLATLRKKFPTNKLPENILKLTLIHILIALEYLHTHANLIHAGT